MALQDIPRERWLAHLERVIAVAEARKGHLDADELAAIARELGIDEADLAAAAQEAADHLARGQGFLARGLFHDAIAELTEAHTLAPARLDISLALARAHQRRGEGADLEFADRLARMALEWEPGDETAFAILADLDATRRARAVRRRRLTIAGAALLSALALAPWLPSGAVVMAVASLAAWLSARPGAGGAATPAPKPVTAPAPAPALTPAGGGIPKDVEIKPGLGLSNIRVGVSTPQDVLATFGDDAKIHRYDSGEIFSISYDYDETGHYDPARRRNLSRPHSFDFKREVLSEIDVGVYNRRLRTPGGLNVDTSGLDDAILEFGDRYEHTEMDHLDSYHWVAHGIEVWIDRTTRKVNSFKIIPGEDR